MLEFYDQEKVSSCISICADTVEGAGCNMLESFMVFKSLSATLKALMQQTVEGIETESLEQKVEQLALDSVKETADDSD